MKTIVKLAGAALLALAALVAPAGAQDYPNKPIRLIVPYPPGGGVDICARILAELLGAKLGQPMIVENKPGATSTIGVEFVAKSAPDGYTLLATNSDGMTIVPNVKRTVPYSVPKDFTFISRLLLVPLTVSVYSGVPAKNMTEFIAYAKANPGKLRYGTSGVGSGPHFAALLLEKAAGLKMVHVPYKGSGPNIQDLMGGHIDLSLNAVQAIVPVVSSGKIRMLALTSPTRDPFAPDVPTMTEIGLPDATLAIMYGLVGPAGMPAAVTEKLRRDTVAVLNSPEAKAKFQAAGFQPSPLAGDEFEKFVMAEYRTMKAIAEAEKIVVDE